MTVLSLIFNSSPIPFHVNLSWLCPYSLFYFCRAIKNVFNRNIINKYGNCWNKYLSIYLISFYFAIINLWASLCIWETKLSWNSCLLKLVGEVLCMFLHVCAKQYLTLVCDWLISISSDDKSQKIEQFLFQ